MVHAIQKLKHTLEWKQGRKHKCLGVYSLWEDFAFSCGKVGPKSTFLPWVNSPVSFVSVPYCSGVEGFVAVWLFISFVTNCLLFVLLFHNLLSLYNFSFCVLFPSLLFPPPCPIPLPRVVLFCFVCRGMFVTVPFLRKHGSRKLHPPYQVLVPAPQHVGGFVWDFLGKWVPSRLLFSPPGWNVAAAARLLLLLLFGAAVWGCCFP